MESSAWLNPCWGNGFPGNSEIGVCEIWCEGRPGVLYQRKRDGEGSLEDRFAAGLNLVGTSRDQAGRTLGATPGAP